MKHLIVILILLMCVDSIAEQAWSKARAQPAGRLAIHSYKTLMKIESQISCGHLSFRYSELEKIINEASWIYSAAPNGVGSKIEAHNYIMNRLKGNPNPIAGRSVFQVKYLVDDKKLKLNESPVEAIVVLGAVNFDLLFPSSGKGFETQIQEVSGGLSFSTSINAYDICSKKYIDVFLLRKCPASQTQDLQCGDVSCPPSLTYDWQACEDVESYRVNLKGFESKLGLRKREIKRSL